VKERPLSSFLELRYFRVLSTNNSPGSLTFIGSLNMASRPGPSYES
jgi:hypothetical protein